MRTERGRSRSMPQDPEQPPPRRDTRRSARPFQAAPLIPVAEETDEEDEPKESKMRRFFRAIGFGCFMSKKNNQDNGAEGPALRAIAIDDARYAFNRNMLDSEDGSVYSSHYGGRGHNPYMLYLGTENKTNFKPTFARDPPRPGEPQILDLSELRPSMQERELPVFFTPPPPDIVASVTPRRRAMMTYSSPQGSPVGAFA